MFHFYLTDTEQRIQLINLCTGILLIQGVGTLIHTLIHLRSLLITSHPPENLRTLFLSYDDGGYIAIAHDLIIIAGTIVIRPGIVLTLQVKLGIGMQDRHRDEVATSVSAFLHLLDILLRLIQHSQSQVHLGTGEIIVGIPYLVTRRITPFPLALLIHQILSPLRGDHLHLLIALLINQCVTIVREDITGT